MQKAWRSNTSYYAYIYFKQEGYEITYENDFSLISKHSFMFGSMYFFYARARFIYVCLKRLDSCCLYTKNLSQVA